MQQLSTTETFEIDDNQEGLYLTFSIGDDTFGIGIRYVREIIGIQPITVIPEFPEHIKGVINLREKIIPVMDVRLRFGKPAQEYDGRTCIIVVNIHDTSIGLIVDRVAEVIAIPNTQIASPPEINQREVSYIEGFGKVGGGIKILLDCDVLLNSDADIIKSKKEN